MASASGGHGGVSRRWGHPPPTRAASPTTGPGIARTLLAIEFLRGAGYFAAGLGFLRALSGIGLIHHDRVVQQLPAHPRSEFSGVDLVGADLLAGHVVDGEIHLAPFFLLTGAPAAAIRLTLLVRITVTNDPLGPGTAPRMSRRF